MTDEAREIQNAIREMNATVRHVARPAALDDANLPEETRSKIRAQYAGDLLKKRGTLSDAEQTELQTVIRDVLGQQ